MTETYEELTSTMLKGTSFRGHNMLPTSIDTTSGRGHWECVKCKKGALVLSNPAPNQTYISGEALTLGCNDGFPDFASWMTEVNNFLITKCDLGHQDLADQPWRDWHDDGISPREAAEEALENEGFYDFMGDK